MELKRPEVNEQPGSLYKSMQHASWDVLSNLSRLVRLEGGFLILSDLFLRHDEHEAWLDHLLIHRYGSPSSRAGRCACLAPAPSTGAGFRGGGQAS